MGLANGESVKNAQLNFVKKLTSESNFQTSITKCVEANDLIDFNQEDDPLCQLSAMQRSISSEISKHIDDTKKAAGKSVTSLMDHLFDPMISNDDEVLSVTPVKVLESSKEKFASIPVVSTSTSSACIGESSISSTASNDLSVSQPLPLAPATLCNCEPNEDNVYHQLQLAKAFNEKLIREVGSQKCELYYY